MVEYRFGLGSLDRAGDLKIGSQRLRSATLAATLGLMLAMGASARAAGVTVSPDKVNFGGEVFGVTGATSASERIRISNPAAGPGVTNLSLSIQGTNAADFMQTATDCTSTLAAGAHCDVSIAFTPSGLKQRVARLTIGDNISPIAASASLVGTGAEGKIIVTPGALSFPATPINGVSAAKTVTLRNPNSVALDIVSVIPTGPFQPRGCVGNLAAKQSCQISVTFQPTTASGHKKVTVKGSLAIADDAGTNMQSVKLSGIALGSTAAGGPLPADIWVTDNGTGLVSFFTAGSSGNAPPATVLRGANTMLAGPYGIVEDAGGNIFVSNVGGNPQDTTVGTITGYPAGRSGDQPPSLYISGDSPADGPVLAGVLGIVLDSNDDIYTSNENGGPNFMGSVAVFAAGSSGNANPSAVIRAPSSGTNNTGLQLPTGVALDKNGNIYVVNDRLPQSDVTEYPAGSDGSATPIATITGPHTGLASALNLTVDSKGNIYVLNDGGGPLFDGSVTIYPPGSNGDAKPMATIAGAHTMLGQPRGVVIDPKGNIYVANEVIGARSFGNITVYGPGSNGDVAPIALIAGAATGLQRPTGVAVRPQ